MTLLKGLGDSARGWGFPWLVLGLLCALPFLFRMHVLSIPIPLNLDEGQWTVTARSVFDDPILWRSIDMQTSGPLNAVAIAWPKLFGITPSIFTTRLTGLILQGLALLGLARFIRRGEALSLGAAAIFAVATWVTLTPMSDFLCYSSECVPVALIVLFCIVFAGLRTDSPIGPPLALCGLIAGAMPFAKMQSAPFALVFQAACVLRLGMDIRARRANVSDVVWWLVGSVMPILLLVAPLFLVGEQDAFLKGYLGLASGYGGSRTIRVFVFTEGFIVCMGVLWAVTFAGYRDMAARAQARWDLLAISVGLWPAALLAVWFPGRVEFRHYNWFILVGLPLSVLLAQYSLPVFKSRFSVLVRVFIILLVVGVCTKGVVLDARAKWLDMYKIGAMDRAFAPPGADSRPLYAWTGAGPKDTLLQWGWEPGLTAYSGLRSAERGAIAEYLIRPNPGRDYFRERLLHDLPRTNPAIILDTIRDGNFFNNDPGFKPGASDVRSFPALSQIVDANYERVAGGQGRCSSLYLRKDYAAALRAAEVPLKSAIAPLVDGATTELCDDWWAPASPDATAELTVEPPAVMKELWILSSRGGRPADHLGREFGTRGTTKVKIHFVAQSGAQSDQTASLHAYPNWTVIQTPDIGPIARIEIQSLEYVGEGPALAGVRAFNRAW